MTDEQRSIGAVAHELGITVKQARSLADAGVLTSTTTPGGHRRFDLAQVRREFEAHRLVRAAGPAASFAATFALAGLAEHEVWSQLRAAIFPDDRPEAARKIAGYASTEMLNNAIDHSGGTTASVHALRDRERVAITITDDGIGVFRKLIERFGLADGLEAIQELHKGKLTTAPAAHTGEGIFFTSKLVDRFSLAANGLEWIVDNDRDDVAVLERATGRGTTVEFAIRLDTSRAIHEIFDAFAGEHGFVRSRTTIRLFELGTEFVSRSEAKRVASRLDQFEEVELDFAGVAGVGQGFVDELFRVWAGEHPGTRLLPIRMNDEVRFMVQRGLPRRPGS
jgi:anti-sigma regulatory factor (Ser/Thr protein kinase)